jgi:hypothetical protein
VTRRPVSHVVPDALGVLPDPAEEMAFELALVGRRAEAVAAVEELCDELDGWYPGSGRWRVIRAKAELMWFADRIEQAGSMEELDRLIERAAPHVQRVAELIRAAEAEAEEAEWQAEEARRRAEEAEALEAEQDRLAALEAAAAGIEPVGFEKVPVAEALVALGALQPAGMEPARRNVELLFWTVAVTDGLRRVYVDMAGRRITLDALGSWDAHGARQVAAAALGGPRFPLDSHTRSNPAGRPQSGGIG